MTDPETIRNAPGLPAIGYRIGRHATFKDSMLADLSGLAVPALADLGARDDTDATIALVDGCAVMADILTFYQERIITENYLGTATERRSVVELARLLGYQPDPGVAANASLAFTLERSLTQPAAPPTPLTIPAGSKVQSVPGPGELPHTFETTADIEARVEWNAIGVQSNRPQPIFFGQTELVLAGTGHQLAAGDVLLIVGSERRAHFGSEQWDIRLLREVQIDDQRGITRVRWAEGLGSATPRVEPARNGVGAFVFRQRAAVFGHNAPDPRLMSRNGTSLDTLANLQTGRWNGFDLGGLSVDLDQTYPKVAPGGWIALISDGIHRGGRAQSLPGYAELFGVVSVAFPSVSAFGLGSKVTRVGLDTGEHLSWYERRDTLVLAQSEALPLAEVPILAPLYGDRIVLDGVYPDLARGQALAVSGTLAHVRVAPDAGAVRFTTGGGRSTRLTPGDRLDLAGSVDTAGPGGSRIPVDPADLEALVRAGSETVLRWPLADRDGTVGVVETGAGSFLLDPAAAADPVFAEIARISASADAVSTDRDHTVIRLEQALRRAYECRSLRVNGNVASATEGETVSEILGSGDARAGGQTLALKQVPLTFVSAATPSGRASTLMVQVDGTTWTQHRTLYQAGPRARVFTVVTADDGSTTVTFGDGIEGSRLPSGQVNLRAWYRKGLGRAGNARAGALSTLLSQPLGVSAVTNPEPATGGDDPESLHEARRNAPLTVLTLDRAVSRRDYEDFARGFAGVGKAGADWIQSGPARGVTLTVAGINGAAILSGSPLHTRLVAALRAAGDRLLPLRVCSYRPARFRLEITVKFDDHTDADAGRAAVRAGLGSSFGFDARSFGQAVSLDEVVAQAHRTRGVIAVDVTVLRRSDGQANPAVQPRLPAASATADGGQVIPAELLTLEPDTVIVEAMP